MGARPVKLTVQNNTNQVLNLKSKKLKHGKFTSNPPEKIKSSGSWKCSGKNGAMIGPEGTVTYEAEDKSFTVAFDFDHPYSSATSTYNVTEKPTDAVGYKITGDFTGRSQDITYTLYPA